MDDRNLKEFHRLLDCLNVLIDEHKDWVCHNPSGTGSGSGGGQTGATGESGKDGKSLEFLWKGTKLGIRVEGQNTYQYVELKGEDGVSPHIDQTTGHWFVGTSDTGITAQGLRGPDGNTPTFKIGTVTTLPAGSSATVSITGTPDKPILNLGIPEGAQGDPATNTDEKVKMSSSSSNAQYLEDWVDKTTIIFDPAKNVLKAVSLDGLEASITTLNFIKNLDKDIMAYLGAVSNPMQFRATVADDASLLAYPNPESGDTFIVRNSVSNGNKTMTFIYDGANFEPIAETSIYVRDFTTDPINLATESTGTVPESQVDPLIARLSDVLTKAAYGGSDNQTVKQADKLKGMTKTVADIESAVDDSHTHTNKTLLDSLVDSGDGSRFLSNDGTYSGIFWLSSSAPTNKGIFWVDNSDPTTPTMKFHDGIAWVPISSSGTSATPVTVDSAMSGTSTNPVENKVVKAYIDALDIPEISDAQNNAIAEKPDGWFVEDPTDHIDQLQEEIRILRKSQYHVNTDLDYVGLQIPGTGDVGVNQTIPLVKYIGNLEVNDNLVTLYAGKTYKFDTHLSYSSDSGTGSTSWSSITLTWFDVTNNVEIGSIHKYGGNQPRFEFEGSSSFLYTPETDCEVKLYAKEVFMTDRVDPLSNATITEVGRAIQVEDPQIVNSEDGIEDTPIGTIIPLMSKSAPKHYLICDGTEYNIADYPYLADHIRDEFGTIDYFGGDGTTTFAVPDLRGEFLRGAGKATRATGTGAAVGVHQDATQIPWVYYWVNPANNKAIFVLQWRENEANNPTLADLAPQETVYYKDQITNIVGTTRQHIASFTARPTNTSVLWCIKAEPTYFMKVEGKDIYSTEKHLVGYWVDGKPLYEKTIEMFGGDVGETTVTPHGITNYETIFAAQGSIILEPVADGTFNGAVLPFSNAPMQTDDVGVWVRGDNIHTAAGRDRRTNKYYINVRWTEK